MLGHGGLLIVLIAATVCVVAPTPRQTGQESLRSALDAVTRKQRSLDANSQEYYNDLHSFKYHGGDPERKFERERPGEQEVDEEDEEIEFLPNENGQLETIGDGSQSLNNRWLERALVDYLENLPEQESVPSLFRERERSSSRKRGSSSEGLGIDNKESAKLFLEEMQDGSPYGPGEVDDQEYLDTLQMLYDRYRAGQGSKLYENEGPISWRELLNKESIMRGPNKEADENEYPERDQDQSLLYLSPAERRNVNGRYPIGRDFRNYRSMVKRYPVAKRSPKPLQSKKQVTDPKVAQDLGVLFGTQSTDGHNYTRSPDHEHSHDHDHDHEHDHNHDHDHNHEHDHNHDHDSDHGHGEQNDHKNSSEVPKITPLSKGQKENVTKVDRPKSIEVRKKSVDWSQYFGIDKRKKKATFMAGQGTQNQDDEWMLQRYYENMAENLKPVEREFDREDSERKDKLDQMDSKLRNIKELIIEEALRYADTEDGADIQKIKDKIMSRMVAAYSLAKMRKALSDLRNNLASKIDKTSHAQNNLTANYHDNDSVSRTDEKRSGNSIDDNEGFEGKSCPALESIEWHCKGADNLAGDGSQILYLPCVMLHICKACAQDDLKDECLRNYAVEAGKVCDMQEARQGQRGREECASTALILSQLQPFATVGRHCHTNGNEFCLRRYYYRYRHRYFRYPYATGRRLGVGYESAASQLTDQ